MVLTSASLGYVAAWVVWYFLTGCFTSWMLLKYGRGVYDQYAASAAVFLWPPVVAYLGFEVLCEASMRFWGRVMLRYPHKEVE
jgi:hypothetical protein